VSDKTDHPPLPEAFAALGVRPSILRALAVANFVKPSEIQSLLIPRALAGVDILGQARTGTGKTAAFGIPVLQMATKGLATQAIILVPTRELAQQVEEELKRLAQFTPIRIAAVFGGQKIVAQMKHLKHGPEVLVGTPGRVIDMLDRRIISFENIRFVILDEVDRMLDIGFRDDIRNILGRVKGVRRKVEATEPQSNSHATEPSGSPAGSAAASSGSNETPSTPIEHKPEEPAAEPHGSVPSANAPSARGHQTMFVSATISDEIDRLARRYMREPVEKLIAPGADDKPTVEKIEQFYCPVQPWDKYRLLRTLLQQEQPELAIVFCRTKRGAEKVAKKLHFDGIECREIHGNLAQNKRESVMKSFRGGKFDVLVATDLASRGIDVLNITHIINYDIPEDPEAYVHRVGRTARMGATGKAYTFVTKEQGDELTKVENLINMVVPKAEIPGWEPRPTPDDWTEGKPGEMVVQSKPIVNRYERPYSASGAAPVEPVEGQPAVVKPAMPPRTIGSKIPVNRRRR
jgi:superfamily II DNA/RNA helicase